MEKEFTHELIADVEYYENGPQQAVPPNGIFKKGTKVILLQDNGSYSVVTSETDVTAHVTSDALKSLGESSAY